MSNLNLKGVWIPIEILTDNKLSDKEKYIYAIILYLSKENNYCYLTNKSISELLNISITQVSKLVNSLKDKNYISIELIYKENSKQIEMRKQSEERIKQLKELEEKEDSSVDIDKLVKDFVNMKEITRTMLVSLVDKIEISENKEITIYYKFNILNMGKEDNKLQNVG